MCTAAVYKTKDFYFGRTLDHNVSYGEEITVTPRNYPFVFRHSGTLEKHYAMIGMAYNLGGCPLYYDAVNEKGLCIAGLNFPKSAVYGEPRADKENVAQFELIPLILGSCATADEAEKLLRRINITDESFDKSLPAARLHWLIADRERAVVAEPLAGGLRIYDNRIGVLTNEPPFEYQLFALGNYMGLSAEKPLCRFSEKTDFEPYSLGMGAIGLPGDLSSQSRFVRAAFVRLNSISGDSEEESVGQFFHILGAVEQPRGCCRLEDGGFEKTVYTSCCNADRGIYYYTTYGNRRITAVDMHKEELDGVQPVRYTLLSAESIKMQN